MPTNKTQKHDQARAELLSQLHDKVATLSESDEWRAWLSVAARFHQYSANNVLLIWLQRPDATRVAGYQAWRKLGRQVQAGEKSIKVLAPLVRRVSDPETEVHDPAAMRRVVTGFRVVSVFDVAQTTGDPLPPSPIELLQGDGPAGVLEALEAVADADGLTVSREDTRPGVNGYLDRKGRQIVLSPTLDPAAQVKTLAHELGHYWDPWLAAQPEGYPFHRGLCEVVAESVAFIVGDALGLDTSAYSVGYVASWADGDAKKVLDLAGRINSSADAILSRIEGAGEVVPDAA